MFTGIVTAVGTVAAARGGDGAHSLRIRAPYRGLRRGESVAVNGACLTVARVLRGAFEVAAVDTTLARTLLGEYAVGRRVNLERAVRAADRLGGHLVQGHVDGVAVVTGGGAEDGGAVWDLRVPSDVAQYCVPLGSITVDGVSLTINALPDPRTVQISLIPETRTRTTLGTLAVGDRVHVEADVLAKYVRHLCRSTP